MNDPDLKDLEAFVAVARTRNFRRAAVDLRISVSSLSQRLRDMEERLGVRLLHRTTRSVSPTQAGELLLSRAGPAIRDAVDALKEVRGLRDVPSGRLRINAPPPAVQLVLAPMVGPFLRRYPQVRLEIVAESSLIDIVAAGFDAGVRYDEHLARDMIAVSLGAPERYPVVASPDFLKARGRIGHPKDLLDHPCIMTRFSNGLIRPWDFEKAGRTLKIAPEGALIANNTELQVQAAVGGAGFLKTFEGLVREAIAARKLVTVLDDWCPTYQGPLLYYPSRRQLPPALGAFVGFVKEWRKTGGDR
jgi:DNA-binding transcriptional LysR family regulator